MIVFLIRNVEQSVDTMGLNILLAILPLHLLALPLGGHLADGLGHRLALPLDHGDLGWLVLDGLEEDRILCGSTIVCGNLDRHLAFLQRAIFPCYISAIFIASPDLFSFSIDLPFCITLLLGHVDTDRHLLQLCDCPDISMDAVPRQIFIDNDLVSINFFINRIFLNVNFMRWVTQEYVHSMDPWNIKV